MALSTTQYGYIIDPMVPFTDGKGNTIKDGFVRVFVAGSSTPVVTYRNFDGAANQDLIELDNSGRTKTSVIGSKGFTYKVCVYDKHHSQESPILTVDKVSVIGANITAGAGATLVTGLDGLTTKPDGFVDASVVGTDGYVALDHTLVTDDLNTDAKVTAVENDRYIPLLNDDVNDPDSKITLGRLWQWVLGKIKSLSTTITAFRTGDVIPVDGPDGTAKMSKDSLLEQTCMSEGMKAAFGYLDIDTIDEGAYYNKYGQRVSDAGFRSVKIFVKPNTCYTFVGTMFSSMAVCEFDSNSTFVTSHKIDQSSPSVRYYRVDFKTSYNTSYVWCSTQEGVLNTPRVFENPADFYDRENKLASTSESYLIKDKCVSLNPSLVEVGYYSTGTSLVSNDEFLTYTVAVKPNTWYTWTGSMFSVMKIYEYDAGSNVVASHSDNPCSLLSFKTTASTTTVKIPTHIRVEEPFLYESDYLSFVESSENNLLEKNVFLGRLSPSDEKVGWYDSNAVFHPETDGWVCRKFKVKPNHKYKFIGAMFAGVSICEYDSGDTFLGYHRIAQASSSTRYYTIEFSTKNTCSYLWCSSSTSNLNCCALYDLEDIGGVLPEKVYCAVGLEKDLYYDRFGFPGSMDVYIRTNNDSDNTPMQERDKLLFSGTGTKTINFRVYGEKGNLLGTDDQNNRSASVEIFGNANPAAAKNVLWIGDSISDYQNSAQYAKELFTANIGGVVPTFVGTRHTAGTPDESYAGRNTHWLLTDAGSPFVFNGNLDFTAYNTARGVAKIHICVMQMGFNDAGAIAAKTRRLEEVVADYRTFVEAITSANSGIQIVWCLPPLESSWIQAHENRRHTDAVNALRLALFGLAKEYGNVILSDAFYCIDSVNGYPNSDVPIASVYSSLGITEKYCTDSTHPTALGCKQWAQQVYPAMLKAIAVQDA